MARICLGLEQRRFTGGVAEVEMQAGTVRQLIAKLDARFPGIGAQLEGTAVAIDGDIVADAAYEPVPEHAEIHFVPSASGG